MKEILLIVVAIIPVFLIGFYIYKKDREKESQRLLTKLFLLGILSCIPTILLSLILDYIIGSNEPKNLVLLFFYVLIKIALVEELCKWFMVYKAAYNDREFNHIYDAIVYSVFVSLGFAFFENVFYALDGGIKIGLLRGITAVPCHAINAILMGNYLGLAKQNDIKGNKKEVIIYKILSIIVPTLAHGIYDFCIYAEIKTFLIIFLVYILLAFTYAIIKVRKVSKIEKNIDDFEEQEEETKKLEEHIDNYYENHCPVCGNIINKEEKKCPRCGADLFR